MRAILGSIVAIILGINGFIILVISILVGFFSNFYFGFAVFILGLLVIISSPKLNLKIGENQWSLGIPVFPGVKALQTILVLIIACALGYGLFGDKVIDSSKDSFENSRAQMAMRNKIYVVSPAYCYWEKEGKWVMLDNEIKAISLKERKEIPEKSGEIYLKMRLESTESRFDGPVMWVPVLRVSKSSVPSSEKDSSADVYIPPSAKVKKEMKKTVGDALEISFSPEQVVARDIHKSAPDKLLLDLDGFRQGETFELMEDFSFQVRGDNLESWVLIGGLKVDSPIEGQLAVLKKGKKYLIHNQYSNFGICTNGGEIYDFSEFKIRKVL